MNEHETNLAYESMLENEWERYNEEGAEWDGLDPYDLADELYESYRDEACQYE